MDTIKDTLFYCIARYINTIYEVKKTIGYIYDFMRQTN